MAYANSASCLRMYSDEKVVAYYLRYTELEKPEEAILRALSPQLGSMRMLDIGAGGGRMTEHFAPRVGEYDGIDICPEMVAACRKRFLGRIPAERFALRDMRDLHAYPAHAFDFVLITYNTIDHLSDRERMPFIDEVRRITSPGGYFCFSSHNIRSLAAYLQPMDWTALRPWRHPFETIRSLRHRARFLELNRTALEQHFTAEHVVINNGTHGDFGVQLYYILPAAQIEALKRAGFERIAVYSLDTGTELSQGEIRCCADRWLYYLCS